MPTPPDDRGAPEPSFSAVKTLLEGIESALMISRGASGGLHARMMALASGRGDISLASQADPGLEADLASNPHVEVVFIRESGEECVSISGVARLVSDSETVVLLAVDARAAHRHRLGEPSPALLYEGPAGSGLGPTSAATEVREASRRTLDRSGPMKGGLAAARRSGVLESEPPKRRR